jgi:hypothetical protein
MAPKIHGLKEKERLQPDFWEDYKWGLEHYGELREKYAYRWIATANKSVVAFGEDLTDKKEESICREIIRPVVTLFIEGQARIL